MTTSSADLEKLRIRRDAVTEEKRGTATGVIVSLLIGAVVLAAGIWITYSRRAETVAVASVAVSGGSSGVAPGSITANGYVVARTKASVAAKIAGRLAVLSVSEGTRVRKGEIIARLENAEFAAAVEAARARVATVDVQLQDARSKWKRADALHAQGLISSQQLEDATTLARSLETQLASTRADVALARANMENTNVRAPFDGTILRKDAEVGEIVAPSAGGGSGLTRTAIVTMADLATLEVEVDVNEAYIAQVRNGQDARITLDAYPDTSFTGRVRQVVPTANREKATVLVKVSILDRDPRILPEMGAQVAFVREAGQAVATAPRRITVPPEAIVGSGSSARVWVVEENAVRSRSVTTGATRGDRVDITNGLTGGETLVLRPSARLREGARVRVRAGS